MKRILIILSGLLLFATSQAQIGRFPFAKTIATSGSSGLTEGLVGYWKLDETSGDAIDAYGSHDGTVTGSIQGVEGKIDNCYQLAGTATNGVQIGASTDFNLASKGSISVWFVTSVAAWSRGWIIGTMESYATAGYGIYLDSGGTPVFTTSIGSADAAIKYTVNMAASANWHHCVMTWDVDGNLITYLDNTQVDSREITITPTDSGDNLTIGINTNTFNEWVFNGKIDEVLIYNRVLTSDEVSDLYDLTQPL